MSTPPLEPDDPEPQVCELAAAQPDQPPVGSRAPGSVRANAGGKMSADIFSEFNACMFRDKCRAAALAAQAPQPAEPSAWLYRDERGGPWLTFDAGLQANMTPLYAQAQPDPQTVWQPIETAPRSDVTFLAYRPLAHLTHDPNISIVSGRVRDQGCWDETVPTGMQKMNYTSGYCMPTHWMPLPAAPT